MPEENGKVEKPKTRARITRNFPAGSYEDALLFSKSIFEYGRGTSVKRFSLFDHLGKSPDSSSSRQIITNSNKYGLIKGNYQSDNLELTQDGRRVSDSEIPERERAKINAKLAIFDVEPFNGVYERFKNNKVPAKQALIDAFKDFGVEPNAAAEAVETFLANLQFTRLMQNLSGAERILDIDFVLDRLPSLSESPNFPKQNGSSNLSNVTSRSLTTSTQAEFDKTCFYISPIGDEGTETRKHSDLILSSVVEPALEEFKLSVIRADQIDKPGTITKQIFEYLLKSRLVIADLSFHNPNVFYELAIRHATKLPVVQIIRTSDRIPFDLQQLRTIKIDTTDIYSLVPKLEIHKAEISGHVRRALEDPNYCDNPIAEYFPDLNIAS